MIDASEPVHLGMIADVRNHYFREIVSGVLAQARHVGGVRFDYIEPSLAAVRAYPEPLRLRGVLAQPLEPGDYKYLHGKGIAVVNFSSRQSPDVLPSWVAHVLADDRAIGELAAKHFVSNGLRNLGFFGNDEIYYSAERAAGFRDWAAKHGGIQSAHISCWGHGAKAPGIAGWLTGLPHPAGILAAQDHYARTLSEIALAAGLRIPEDISVIGVDADPVLSGLAPARLSSVRPDAGRLGAMALNRVIELVTSGKNPGARIVRVPPVGIHFDESAPRFTAGDPHVAKALRWLAAHRKENVSMDDLALAVGMSRRSLEYAFKTRLGASPYQKLIEMRLTRARELLEETNLPVINVAEEAGFSNQREFSVRFRAKVGLTPTAYRLQAERGG